MQIEQGAPELAVTPALDVTEQVQIKKRLGAVQQEHAAARLQGADWSQREEVVQIRGARDEAADSDQGVRGGAGSLGEIDEGRRSEPLVGAKSRRQE